MDNFTKGLIAIVVCGSGLTALAFWYDWKFLAILVAVPTVITFTAIMKTWYGHE